MHVAPQTSRPTVPSARPGVTCWETRRGLRQEHGFRPKYPLFGKVQKENVNCFRPVSSEELAAFINAPTAPLRAAQAGGRCVRPRLQARSRPLCAPGGATAFVLSRPASPKPPFVRRRAGLWAGGGRAAPAAGSGSGVGRLRAPGPEGRGGAHCTRWTMTARGPPPAREPRGRGCAAAPLPKDEGLARARSSPPAQPRRRARLGPASPAPGPPSPRGAHSPRVPLGAESPSSAGGELPGEGWVGFGHLGLGVGFVPSSRGMRSAWRPLGGASSPGLPREGDPLAALGSLPTEGARGWRWGAPKTRPGPAHEPRKGQPRAASQWPCGQTPRGDRGAEVGQDGRWPRRGQG